MNLIFYFIGNYAVALKKNPIDFLPLCFIINIPWAHTESQELIYKSLAG